LSVNQPLCYTAAGIGFAHLMISPLKPETFLGKRCVFA